ncbi:hypothetical protein A2U01_0000365 [Trifolium medium]|uniref:Uncharacterized protein n=1 Tax=Trifolium medium TaxID=97028 RepID=A0A392LXC7_9FABA|nr:hypothetical protein [Trifolium medium]
MASSSHLRVDGDANTYFDDNGNPMTTVVVPRNDLLRKDPPRDQQTPIDTDEHIDAVNYEIDPRDGNETAISDDDDEKNVMILDPPSKDSSKSHASVSLQKTNLSKKAPAAIGKPVCIEQQELKISATDFQKLIDSLDDHKALIREQRELLLEQGRRLDSFDKAARHSQYEDASHLQQVPKKRGRTPPRKDCPVPPSKRGKEFMIYEQRPPSPRHTRPMGGNPSTALRDRGKRHSSPNYEALGSDEEENYGPLSLDILNAPLPASWTISESLGKSSVGSSPPLSPREHLIGTRPYLENPYTPGLN